MRLAETEYQRVIDVVDALQFEDWTRPTDCSAWDVRQLVAHIAGHAKLLSSPFELARQLRAAKARQQPGQASIDALTALQVEERQHLGPEELRAELRRVGPRAAKARGRIPGIVRRRRLPDPEVVNGLPETWSIGYASDVIFTRDSWMHRMDLARATGRDPVLTADHDGVIVADIVAEWARRHGQPHRGTHRPRRRELELRHGRRRDRDGCRRLLPHRRRPPRARGRPTLGASRHPSPVLSGSQRHAASPVSPIRSPAQHMSGTIPPLFQAST
jgi:uncharacterized protein (TIGR03083 family)